jgi:CRP-like cAMP-binding protein
VLVSPNRLLKSLQELGVHLNHHRTIDMKHKQLLFDIGDTVEAVYFPFGAIISIVAPLTSGESLEVAMVGDDGAAGIGAVLDGRASRSRGIVQHPGQALAIDAFAFRNLVLANSKAVQLMFYHEQRLLAEVQQSAACVSSHQVENRMARWLLEARNLAQTDVLQFTQEYVAEMLAVRRTSVSPSAAQLQSKGLIEYARGKIIIKDVEGLRALACECFAVVDALHKE